MANEGLQLDRFYAHPVCSPTRAALMTGQSPTRLGVIRPISKIEKKGLPLDRTILPQFFSEAGYQTLMVGKWHLGHARTEYLPTSRGFEHFYGHVTGGIGFWDKVHGGGYDWQRNGTTVREDGYTTHLIADEAVQLIEDRDTARPLFLYAAFNAPHLPNEAPEETINSYPDIENINRRTHAAMVTELDTAVGRIIDALGAADMLDNTIVWFISDNGGLIPGLYSARTANLLDRDGNPLLPDSPKPEKFIEFININNTLGTSNNHPYKKGKSFAYEGGIHVPAIIWWPEQYQARRVTDMITVEDILPTLLSIAGIPNHVNQQFDGADQSNVLTQNRQTNRPDFHVRSFDGSTIIRNPWKLTVPPRGTPKLYNLEDDPTEEMEIADNNADIVQTLLAAIEAFPKGKLIGPPAHEAMWDPDFFGGEEDRAPWADVVDK